MKYILKTYVINVIHTHNQIVERAEAQIVLKNLEKTLSAVKSSSNTKQVKDNAKQQQVNRFNGLVNSYMAKAEHIEKNKKKRGEIYQEQTERKRLMLVERQQKRERLYEQRKSEDEKIIKENRKVEEAKNERAKFLAKKIQIESKQYWKELVEFNKNLQVENKKRIDKIQELRRTLVWDKHKLLQDKNNKKSEEYQMKQCMLRTQTIYNLGGKERVYQYIDSLRKADPNQLPQRQILIHSLKSLNGKMHLKALATLPQTMENGKKPDENE